MKPELKLLIVDDHPVVLEGLKSLLTKLDGLVILGSFTTGKETLEFLKNHSVDLVLLDIGLPDIQGTELCLKIKKMAPETQVLAISNYSERSMVMQMLQNGASGYLLKNSSVEELSKAIQKASLGEIVFGEAVKKIMARGKGREKGIPRLTKREKQILKQVALGHTTAVIAEKLFISPLTVETHRRNLMQKFGVHNAAALIKLASDHHLL